MLYLWHCHLSICVIWDYVNRNQPKQYFYFGRPYSNCGIMGISIYVFVRSSLIPNFCHYLGFLSALPSALAYEYGTVGPNP